MDNSSVCHFTDNDEKKVTNLLALEITIEESHCQGTGRLPYPQGTLGILVDNTAKAQTGILPPRISSPTPIQDA